MMKPFSIIARGTTRFTALAVATALSLGVIAAGNAHAQSAPDRDADPTGAGTAATKLAPSVDPALGLTPNNTAAAISIRATERFGKIDVVPADRSGNSRALIEAVEEDDEGIEELRNAIRDNPALRDALARKRVSVARVISASTDDRNDITLFVR